MKKLFQVFLALSIFANIFGCSSVFEPLSTSTSIKLNVNEILSRVVTTWNSDQGAELKVTIYGNGIKTQSKTIYMTENEYQECFEENSTIIFSDIPEGKEVTITAEFNILASNTNQKEYITSTANGNSYTSSYKGTVKYKTGDKEHPVINLTPSFPAKCEKTFHIVNNTTDKDTKYTLGSFFTSNTYSQLLSDVGGESETRKSIGLILDEDITINYSVNMGRELNSFFCDFYIDLNGKTITFKTNELIDSSNPSDTANINISYGNNVYIFNGTITSNDTESNQFSMLFSTTTGKLQFKNCTFKNIPNRIINAYSEGELIIIDCTFNNNVISLSEVSDYKSVISLYEDEEYHFSPTLYIYNSSFKNCKSLTTQNGTQRGKAIIRVKGTAHIYDCTFEADYTNLNCEYASILEIQDSSKLYLTGSHIKTRGTSPAVYGLGDSQVFLDYQDQENKYFTSKNSSIDAQNAIKLTGYVNENYNLNSYLIIANNAMLSGTVNFEGVMGAIAITDVASIPKICTVNYTNKSKIKLNITFKGLESTPNPLLGNTRIIITSRDEIIYDDISCEETINHITLLNEDLIINDEGELELAN